MEPKDQRQNSDRERLLKQARRVVVKVGTSTVTADDGRLATDRVWPIVRSIAGLMRSGRQMVLVSSGAIGLGHGWLDLHSSRLKDMVTKQACAAVGQSLLMEAYKRLFGTEGIKIAQVLLTEEDFSNWRRYSNLQRTMEKLLSFGVLPVVNENDTVSTAELEIVGDSPRSVAFSDNDRLAALVMSGLEADVLVLMTNVDGFLSTKRKISGSSAGSQEESATISVVEQITPELKALASGPSIGGRGGMQTKLEAAEIAMNCGGVAVIANGRWSDSLQRIFAGEPIGTAFLPSSRMRGKRRWIAYAAGVRGRVVVDAGAFQAIVHKKASLLASGVVQVEGSFGAMDVVSIVDLQGNEFARGIASCASGEVEGTRKARALTRNGARQKAVSAVVVIRDNIVLLPA